MNDLERYAATPASSLAAHAGSCCVETRIRVLTSLDAGSVESTLAAVPGLIKWSAIAWPAYWCDLNDASASYRGDCGVHAALAAVVLTRYAVPFQHAMIAIQSSRRHMEHWRDRWVKAGVHPTWIGQDSVYHEVLAVGSRFWDPSEARWFQGVGADLVAGRVLAVKVGSAPWLTDARQERFDISADG